MRIAYIVSRFPHVSETFIVRELNGVERAGDIEIALFSLFAPVDETIHPDAALWVERLRIGSAHGAAAATLRWLVRRPLVMLGAFLRVGWAYRRRPRLLWRALLTLTVASAHARTIRELGVRHVHAHYATYPALAAWMCRRLTAVPYSFTAHAHDIFVEWERVEEKLAAARFAVTVCEYNRRFIDGRAPAQAHKLRLVICGVDVEEFRRTRPYDADGPVVAVGRLVEQKGFDVLVRAAAATAVDGAPEVVIAGEGPERARLERLIDELGAPVRLAGALDHRAVRDLLESASMAVLPCVVAPDGNRDSMPVALKEAMALELPVIGTDEVGLPELIGPDRGLLVPPGDAPALARALAELRARSAAERVEMGRAGRAFVGERCNLHTETARLLDLFELDAR